jgi:lipid A 3-O-deacylase
MFDGAGVLTLLTLFGAFPVLDGPATGIAEVGMDRLAPTHDDRTLQTTNLHFFFTEKSWDPVRLKIRLGGTLSRVTGEITQLTGSFEDGTLRTERFDSPAWGVGPVAEARFDAWRARRMTLSADLSAGLMLYDRAFPAGGEHYNGMFQIGPTVTWELDRSYRVSVGYRWMHVSNGRGPGPDNPSYEAGGMMLRFSGMF